ncbi:MAG: sucrose phosphorylase [Spirochaetaceae bacterium]|jgi:sucrose phosphorylase|nr:sucrose phosphorylase [Spirochaetaceae bacterium]
MVKNKIQLICYPDSLGGNLKSLNQILCDHLADIVPGGVHILPPFPSSGDRGFAPLTYLQIEPQFGDWNDIREIASQFDIMLDLMVNHISQKSIYFQDFLEKGEQSEYADLFITLDKINDGSLPPQEIIDRMFLRRTNPYSTYTIKKSGKEVTLWTTFGKTEPSEQVDLDVHSKKTKVLLESFLKNFSEKGVNLVRLDAVGYIIKKLGTSCFFVEPEIFEYLDWISEIAASYNIELLPEVHAHHSIQNKLAQKGHWIYDFILPYRILEALLNRRSGNLIQYLAERSYKQFTMLDCHDGLPVKPDMDGLIDTKEARKIVDLCVQRGSNLSLIYSAKYKDEDGFDVHQIRGTIYSMLHCNDDAYMAARALQFFTPGIPQVYYVGLLAGENDVDAVKIRGDGRELNRHNFTMEEIQQALKKPVVQRLFKLAEFRNSYDAFNGTFNIDDSDENTISLSWKKENTACRLTVDFLSYTSVISYVENGQTVKYSL